MCVIWGHGNEVLGWVFTACIISQAFISFIFWQKSWGNESPRQHLDWCTVRSNCGGVFQSVYVICAGSDGSTSPTRWKWPCISSSVPLGPHNSPTETSSEPRDAIPAWPDAHFCLRATFSSSNQGCEAEKTWNNREEFEPGVALLGGGRSDSLFGPEPEALK